MRVMRARRLLTPLVVLAARAGEVLQLAGFRGGLLSR